MTEKDEPAKPIKSIFRAEALAHYLQPKHDPSWQQISLPKHLAYIWVFIFLLLAASLAILFTYFPVLGGLK